MPGFVLVSLVGQDPERLLQDLRCGGTQGSQWRRCFEWFVIFNHILMILHMNHMMFSNLHMLGCIFPEQARWPAASARVPLEVPCWSFSELLGTCNICFGCGKDKKTVPWWHDVAFLTMGRKVSSRKTSAFVHAIAALPSTGVIGRLEAGATGVFLLDIAMKWPRTVESSHLEAPEVWWRHDYYIKWWLCIFWECNRSNLIWVNELVDKTLLMPIHEGGMYNLSHQDVEADMAMSLSQMSGASDAMG